MMTVAILVIAVLTGASMMIWGLGSLLVRGFSTRKWGVILLLGGLVLVSNAALYVRDTYWQNASRTTTDVSSKEENGPSARLSQPEAVCRLLIDHGLTPEIQEETGKIWGKATPMFYSCQATRTVTSQETPTSWVYHVQSDEGRRVDLVRLQVEIVDDRQETEALEEFKRLSSILFDRLPVAIPEDLTRAVDARNFRRFEREGGSVELLRDRRQRGYRLRLEIRPDPRKP